MDRSGVANRAILRLIFAASFASISYELVLMRIFSISLWYHFAFMVISIAMLGISASGTVLSIVPGLRDIRRLPSYTLFLAIGIPASHLLANNVSFDPVSPRRLRCQAAVTVRLSALKLNTLSFDL